MDYRLSPSILEKELEDACIRFKFQELTPSHITTVERETRKQSGSKIWFRQRAGRITASRVKQVLGTKCDNPSKSLIKSICYPEAYQFSTAATR
jgi:nucleoside 2-deoxyribosyltransferase